MSPGQHGNLRITLYIAVLFLASSLVGAQQSQVAEPSPAAKPGWAQYYDRTDERPPRPLLLEALDFFEAEGKTPRRAADAGCGTGVESRFLAAMGVEVLAFDAQSEGIRRLQAALSDAQIKLISTEVAFFYEANWGREVDLSFAGYALPFADADEFPIAWRKMKASLATGGRFVGHLFGDRDDWAGSADMTHHRREEVEALLADDFVIEVLREVEKDRPLATGGQKHWHIYEIIARKR